MATLVEQSLGDHFGMVQFNTLGGINFYANYIPNLTTLKQIRKVLLDNYSCQQINDNDIALMYEYGQDGDKKEIDLNKENELSTIADVCNIHNIENDNTSVKKINMKYIIPTPIAIITENTTNSVNHNEGYEHLSEDVIKEIKKKSYQIFIKTLNGKLLTIRVYPQMMIEDIKKQVFSKDMIPIEQQRLIYSGVQLQDGRTVQSYEIDKETTLHLVLRLRGGMYSETSGKNGSFGPLKNIVFIIDPDITLNIKPDIEVEKEII